MTGETFHGERSPLVIAYLGNFGPSHSTENHIAVSFEALGHKVVRIQEGDTPAAQVAQIVGRELPNVFCWTQTYSLAHQTGTAEERLAMLSEISKWGIPTVGIHLDLWWGLGREGQIAEEPFFRQDFVFTADGNNDERWKEAGVNHIWMPPGVVHTETDIGEVTRKYIIDVVFLGSWRTYHEEYPHRKKLVTWLMKTYKHKFKALPKGRAIRGKELQDLYASCKVVVGDSCLIKTPPRRYFSDRIPETVGRGAFLLHPDVAEVTDGTMYEPGEHLDTWPLYDFSELKDKIDHYLSHEDERNSIAKQGREYVLENHTYKKRMEEVLNIINV